MTHDRDEHRAKCIEAMVDACNKFRRGRGPSWETMEIAFDALNGIACVIAVELTSGMLEYYDLTNPRRKSHD